jgi:hypothetical protein
MIQADFFGGGESADINDGFADSLAAARIETFKAASSKEGIFCPCCDQKVKIWRRRIYKSMAKDLCGLFKLSRDNNDYHHIYSFSNHKSGDFAKLRYWGLIQEQINADTNKRSSGFWRITNAGRLYALNKLAVPRYWFIYNREALFCSEEKTKIIESFAHNFDYQEIMQGYI